MQDQPLTGHAGAYAATAAEASTSGVAWPAVMGGAFGGAALSLVLLALGLGFGLAAVSPWFNAGASATTFTVMAALWLIVVQWISSGLGGYLAGRLRTKWTGLHTHEVFFRDTANGFLSWAVTSVVVAAFLASAAACVMGGATRVAAGAASGAARGAVTQAAQAGSSGADLNGYLIDSLYRLDQATPNAANQDPTNQEVKSETARILMQGMRTGEMRPADKMYLAQLVARRTGPSQPDAAKRVDDVIAEAKTAEVKAREAADGARKAGSYFSLFTGLSMLIGAFIACVAAALGGQRRDAHR